VFLFIFWLLHRKRAAYVLSHIEGNIKSFEENQNPFGKKKKLHDADERGDSVSFISRKCSENRNSISRKCSENRNSISRKCRPAKSSSNNAKKTIKFRGSVYCFQM